MKLFNKLIIFKFYVFKKTLLKSMFLKNSFEILFNYYSASDNSIFYFSNGFIGMDYI